MALPKKKRVYNWCSCQDWIEIRKVKYIRCPICNRRLLPRVITDANDDSEIIGYKIPPHKTYKNAAKS